jgi:hypothetical protein
MKITTYLSFKGDCETWLPFEGGHEIPAEGVIALNRFLRNRHPTS